MRKYRIWVSDDESRILEVTRAPAATVVKDFSEFLFTNEECDLFCSYIVNETEFKVINTEIVLPCDIERGKKRIYGAIALGDSDEYFYVQGIVALITDPAVLSL